MPGDDLDAMPFGEEEPKKEELISDPMVKKATYLIHKLAERRGADYKDIQKKCKKLLGYENLAKVTLEDGHKIIEKLLELTGGEQVQGARVTDDGSEPKEIKNEPAERSGYKELESELGKLAEMLDICVGFSRDIVQEEIGKDNITEATQAMLVKSFAATLFIEASRRGLGR